ncbi:MAG: type 4a pilus biogenesis protein PilO [Candidatus Riflebacteria bacterium]|nr:type 4a pilus biogenesis protein PilO [Candidatus Riflebacteria bacterium]
MKQLLLILPVISICLIGYDYFDQHPIRLRAFYSTQNSLTTIINDIRIAQEASSKIKNLSSEIEKTKNKITELLKRLPQKNEIGNLLEQLSEYASQRGMTIESINPKGIKKKTAAVKSAQTGNSIKVSYEEMDLNIEMTADFRNAGRYFENLEKIPRLVEMVGFQMKSGKSSSNLLDIKMNLKTYIYGGK